MLACGHRHYIFLPHIIYQEMKVCDREKITPRDFIIQHTECEIARGKEQAAFLFLILEVARYELKRSQWP